MESAKHVRGFQFRRDSSGVQTTGDAEIQPGRGRGLAPGSVCKYAPGMLGLGAIFPGTARVLLLHSPHLPTCPALGSPGSPLARPVCPVRARNGSDEEAPRQQLYCRKHPRTLTQLNQQNRECPPTAWCPSPRGSRQGLSSRWSCSWTFPGKPTVTQVSLTAAPKV